jgi:hypothetical protein
VLDGEDRTNVVLDELACRKSSIAITRNCLPRSTVITSPTDQFGTAVTSIAGSGGWPSGSWSRYLNTG